MAVDRAAIYATFPEFNLEKSRTTISAVDAGTETITAVAHGLAVNQVVQFENTGGALPGGLSASTNYYVISAGLTTDNVRVSATPGGVAVNLTDAGSGINRLFAPNIAQDALVDAKLIEGKGQVDYAVFQNSVNADSAVKYKTAHLLALSPSAVNLRLVKKDGSTIYQKFYDDLVYANGWGANRVP